MIADAKRDKRPNSFKRCTDSEIQTQTTPALQEMTSVPHRQPRFLKVASNRPIVSEIQGFIFNKLLSLTISWNAIDHVESVECQQSAVEKTSRKPAVIFGSFRFNTRFCTIKVRQAFVLNMVLHTSPLVPDYVHLSYDAYKRLIALAMPVAICTIERPFRTLRWVQGRPVRVFRGVHHLEKK